MHGRAPASSICRTRCRQRRWWPRLHRCWRMASGPRPKTQIPHSRQVRGRGVTAGRAGARPLSAIPPSRGRDPRRVSIASGALLRISNKTLAHRCHSERSEESRRFRGVCSSRVKNFEVLLEALRALCGARRALADRTAVDTAHNCRVQMRPRPVQELIRSPEHPHSGLRGPRHVHLQRGRVG